MITIVIFIIILILIKNARAGSSAARHTPPPRPRAPPPKPAKAAAPAPAKRTPAPMAKKEEKHTFVKPSGPYRPPLHSGERYEEWMPVPSGKRVVHCSYCGADNLILEKQNPSDCTCYFCREELSNRS